MLQSTFSRPGAGAFAAAFFFHLNVVWIILAAALLGAFSALRRGKGEKAE